MRTLLIARRDGIFEIVMNRPEISNAANREMLAELAAAAEQAETDDFVEGVRAFLDKRRPLFGRHG